VDWGGHYKEWSTILDKLGVDGNEWDCPHDAVATVDSVSLCASHTSPYELPDEVDETERLRRTLGTSENAGEASTHRYTQFLGTTFGSIDLPGVTLGTENDYPIVFAGATFTDDVVLTDTTFHQEVIFRHTTFHETPPLM
jgi:hypothetical protein